MSLFDPLRKNDVLIAAITSVEIVAAMTRRSRGGNMIATDVIAVCNQFKSHLQSEYQVIEITESKLLRI